MSECKIATEPQNRGGIRMLVTRAHFLVRSLLVLIVGALTAVGGASATPAAAVDCATTDLQNAIDNAGPGTTLIVTGRCVGTYTIDENLALLGRGIAVLDGGQDGTTLTISPQATVRLAGLTITGGNVSGYGGGID